jgi:hypothetical protein
MPFQKNNRFAAKRMLNKPLDKDPICFKGYEGLTQHQLTHLSPQPFSKQLLPMGKLFLPYCPLLPTHLLEQQIKRFHLKLYPESVL